MYVCYNYVSDLLRVNKDNKIKASEYSSEDC